MERIGQSIKSSIRGQFIPTSQGLSAEVGLAHLVITDEGDYSPLLPISSKLGLEPHTIQFWKMTRNVSPYVRHVIRKGGKASEAFPLESIKDMDNHYSDSLRKFKADTGKYPLVVTLDTHSLSTAVHQRDFRGAETMLQYHLSEETGNHPIFAIIEIGSDLNDEDDKRSLTKRQGSGRYLFQGENVDDMTSLLVKIGVDYALTRQVRGLSKLVSAL